MPCGKMTEAPPAKKRRWRKPVSQDQRVTAADNGPNATLNVNEQPSQPPSDFLHPEILSDVDLVCRLNEYHVPVDCNCSRDELVELFSKHIMPKPQRRRKRRGQLSANKKAVMEDSLTTAPCKNGSLTTTAHNSSDVSSGITTGSTSNEGKRESTDNEQRIITKRKQNNDPSPPHRKKAFIRNDITWP